MLATARDVTDERLQMEALKESEERFRSLAVHAPIGISRADAAGNVFYVNERMCEIVGVTKEQLMDRNWRQFIHPDDQTWFLKVWQEHLRAGKNLPPHEFRLLKSNGEVHWARCSVALLKDAERNLQGQIATIEDVDDLKTSEGRFRSIFEQAPIGIALLDSNTGRFLQINPTFANILGRTAEEALELGFQAVTHPDDLQADLDNMALLLKGEVRRFRKEKRYIRPDGAVVWVDLTVVALWEEGAAPTQHMVIVEDISQRKQAEERLQTKEAQLAGLLDNTQAVIYLKDRHGRYMLVNNRFRSLFHKLNDEITCKTDFDVFPEHLAKAFQASDIEVWRTESPLVCEEVALHDDGPHTYRSVKFPVKDRQGKMIAIGGVSTDITDLKRAYSSLEFQEHVLRTLLEVQEQEKQFICYEFHDGLIQYVVGSKMTLESYQQKQPRSDRSPVIDDVIEKLSRGIDEGRRVIRGIRPAVLDDAGVRAAIEDLIDQMSDSGIAINFDFDPSIGRLQRNLETTLYRVVQEALNNARKYSGSDRVTINLRQGEGELQLEIEDYGCGFDAESVGASGFGLLGMRERVRLLGGDCRIESVLGRGTRIAIRLPSQAPVEPPAV